MECRSVDVKFINRIPESIALAVITCASCVLQLLQVEQGDTHGMSVKYVLSSIASWEVHTVSVFHLEDIR